MSRITLRQPLWPAYIALLLFTLILTSLTLQQVGASPLPDLINNHENSTEISTDITTNTDVYVIKAVVYEIGILADEDNTTISESIEG
ncbi:hypothetical protein ALC56_06868 [Trachymyrmex septentrionalis]|uniref:Uncharacterized protein n=2 Tax=Trachymyrmex septentrionalis TaxID=34720 RepID=A0A195FFS0_9HYME|nr:hypothetical protein ALC56_06868 [Trachymyrmex septentrionalis]